MYVYIFSSLRNERKGWIFFFFLPWDAFNVLILPRFKMTVDVVRLLFIRLIKRA